MPKKRTQKHTFVKKYIDDIFKNILLSPCVVSMTKLTAKDITKYKTSLIKNKNNLSKEVGNISENDEMSKDDKKLKFDKKSKANKITKYNNTSINDESPKKKQKLETNRIDNSSDENIKSTVKLVDPRTLFNSEHRYLITKLSTSRPKTYLCSAKVNEVKPVLKKSVVLNLIEIEKLHKKYFSKFVQDTIVTIANIIIVILKSNEHHTERQRESSKKISKYQKLKERYDAKQFYERNSEILVTKFKKNFIAGTSYFAEPEFGSAFIMFFLSILSVLQVLDRQRFKTGGIVQLIKLLQKSLIISEINHPNIFEMLHSKTFKEDCMNVRQIIEDSLDTDHGVIDRMPLYFVETTSGKYFQSVIDAVTNSDSNEDLALLIDIAIFQCFINSELKDPGDSLTVQQSNCEIPVTQAIQSHINSDKTIKHLFPASNTDGTYPDISVLRGNKSSNIDNTTVVVESSILQSRALNYFYTSHTPTLQKKISESCSSKVIPIKKRIVASPTFSNIPLVQVTASSSQNSTTRTCITVQQPIQNNISAGNSFLNRAEGNAILIDNRPYKLVKELSGKTRAVFTPTISDSPSLKKIEAWSEAATSTSGQTRAKDNDTYVLQPSIDIIKCSVRYCNSPATIICNRCKVVKYCSTMCQTLDWFECKHLDDCQ